MIPSSRKWLGVALLLGAGAVLGTIAVRARERTYVVPPTEEAEPVPFALAGEVPAGYVVRSFAVDGICCEGCSGKLHRAVAGIDGVREAAVDPVRKEVSVVAREDVEVGTLEGALTFDKYRATAR